MLLSGLDIGNGTVDLTGPQPQDRLLIPHAVMLCPPGFQRDTSLVPPTDDPFDHLHVQIQSGSGPASELLVGEVVLREYPRQAQESREGERKSQSERHVALALTALAAGATRVRQATTTIGVTYGVATALPAAEYQKVQAREDLTRALQGHHTVKFLTGPARGWAGLTVTLNIPHVDILPEGAPAFLALAEREPAIAQQTVIILDVGVRSVEWAVFARGKYQAGLSGGSSDGGLAAAADRILTGVHQEHGPRIGRHRSDVLKALHRSMETGEAVTMAGMGQRIDVTRLAIQELQQTAGYVNRLLQESLANISDVDRIYLVGGAGAILYPHLAQVTTLPLRLASEPLWANALGLYRRACALQDSGRWK